MYKGLYAKTIKTFLSHHVLSKALNVHYIYSKKTYRTFFVDDNEKVVFSINFIANHHILGSCIDVLMGVDLLS